MLTVHTHSIIPADDPRPPLALIWVHGTGGDGRDGFDQRISILQRIARRPVVMVCPDFQTPYQFLLPDADRQLIDWMNLNLPHIALGRSIGGMSGGAQFSHRFAMRHPRLIRRAALLAAGEWTLPDGRSIGMMSDENWFAHAPWNTPAIQQSTHIPAADGWASIDYLIGCGDADHSARIAAAATFAQTLAACAKATHFTWPGGHEPPSDGVIERCLRFLVEA